MNEINRPLRKAYYAALSAITYGGDSVPVYYSELPANVHPDNYIIFRPVSNTDESTKQSADTSSSMQVTVFTKKDLNNAGNACDDICGSVLNAIMPTPGYNITVDDFQVIHTRLTSDLTQEVSMSAQLKYIDRIMVFTHLIYHK